MQPYPWETAEGPSSWDSQQTPGTTSLPSSPARFSQVKRPRIGLEHNSTVHPFSPYLLRSKHTVYRDLHVQINILIHITKNIMLQEY